MENIPTNFMRSGGRYCTVSGCSNSDKVIRAWKKSFCKIHPTLLAEDCPCLQPIKMHVFPRDEKKKNDWISALNRKGFLPGTRAVVCSHHFVDGRPTEEHPNPELHLGDPKTVSSNHVVDGLPTEEHPNPELPLGDTKTVSKRGRAIKRNSSPSKPVRKKGENSTSFIENQENPSLIQVSKRQRVIKKNCPPKKPVRKKGENIEIEVNPSLIQVDDSSEPEPELEHNAKELCGCYCHECSCCQHTKEVKLASTQTQSRSTQTDIFCTFDKSHLDHMYYKSPFLK